MKQVIILIKRLHSAMVIIRRRNVTYFGHYCTFQNDSKINLAGSGFTYINYSAGNQLSHVLGSGLFRKGT